MGVAALQRVGQEGHREQGEIHGDPLGCPGRCQAPALGVQRKRGHVDRVPPEKPLILVQLGGCRAHRGGVGALQEGMDVQDCR